MAGDGSASIWLSRGLAQLWEAFASLLEALRLVGIQPWRRLQRRTEQAVAELLLLLWLLLLLLWLRLSP